MAFMEEYGRTLDGDLDTLAENMEQGEYTLYSDRNQQWKPTLDSVEWGIVNSVVKSGEGTAITNTCNMVFKKSKGRTVFVIYSTDDSTLLYASSNQRAEEERIFVSELMEEYRNGKVTNTSAKGLRAWAKTVRMQRTANDYHGTRDVAPGRFAGDIGFHGGTSRLYSSTALRNVLANIFQEETVGRAGDRSVKNSDRDSTYLDAVNRGDMETAQRMVDETMRAAGFTTKGYHGTRTPGFTTVDGALWLARDKGVASGYGLYEADRSVRNAPHDENGVYSLFYRLGKNLRIDAEGNSWADLPVSEADYPGVFVDEEDGDSISTDAIAEWASEHGYDSVTFLNVDDGGLTTVDVIFNPQRDAKSADPVTYDDNGDVIPLSERGNPERTDIRYSGRSYGGIREALAKKGLDELSKKYGSYFPLSASFDATIRADKTPLVMETVIANSVHGNGSSFTVGKKAFTATYGVKTSVHIKQMGIDADLYANVANESISKAIGNPDEQSTLDVIPHIREILANSILMGIERIAHTGNKGTALYGYRLYNLYWYYDGKKKSPHALVCTVVQDYYKAEGYVFKSIENVTIDRGLPGTKSDMSSPVNDDTYTVAQLYRAVKRIARTDGGLRYTANESDKYLFSYTKRSDGAEYSDRSGKSVSNRSLLVDAFEELIKSPKERELIEEYRANIAKVDDVQERLRKIRAKIRELSKKGEKAQLRELRKTAKELAELIDKYDRKRLKLQKR